LLANSKKNPITVVQMRPKRSGNILKSFGGINEDMDADEQDEIADLAHKIK
jgi:hypothetical protein